MVMKIIKLSWQHSVRMSCVRMVVAAFALLLSLHAHAQQGYAVRSADGKTLTFRYGTPTGTLGVDYYNTDNTTTSRGFYVWGGATVNAQITTVVFEPSFSSARPVTCQNWFFSMRNLTSITGIEYLNTSEVTSMRYMFYNCSSLTSLDVTNFDTSQVTDMIGMFSNCKSLTSLDVTNFNTSNVTNMGNMFSDCSKLTSLDVTKFNTSKVTNMYGMFTNCSSLTSLDVTNFNTSKVTNMSGMFSGCNSLSSLDVTNFDTSQVTDMRMMFTSCNSLSSLDLTNFDTRKVTDMESMFSYCRSLTSLDLSSFNTSQVTIMSLMFEDCSSLTSLDVTNFNTSNVTNMVRMFCDCNSLPSLDVSNFDTSKVTSMQSMFDDCRSLTSLDVTNFDTSKVTSMQSMFENCSSLPSLDVTKFNTSQVTRMDGMFHNCSSLPSLDVTNFNTSNVTKMGGMFWGCSSLPSLDVTNFNTSKVTDMYGMFRACSSLTSLDVTNFNTSNVTNMSTMFQDCSSLSSLDVTNFNTSNVTDMAWMFSNCSSLISLDLRNFDTRNVTGMTYLVNNCDNLKCVVFGKDFSIEKVSDLIYLNKMFLDDMSLRYVDFYLSDDTDAINSANVTRMFAGCPETAVVYLPHGSQEIKDRTNFVYSYNGNQSDLRCPKYYSKDKVDIEFPRQFKTNEAVYDRTATMGSKEYGSVILPFEFKSNSDIQAYRLNEQNQNMTELKMVNVQTVPEHTPFAFKRLGKAEFVMKDNSGNFGITVYPTRSTNAAEKTWTVAGGAPEATPGSPYTGSTGLSNWKTKGYYVKETKTDYDGMYFIQDNYFKRAVGPLNLVDHRALFYPTDAAGAASVFALSFVEEDMATSIEEAETEQTLSEATEIYDASGCRLEEARKGLNIIRMSDGTVKKVFIK